MTKQENEGPRFNFIRERSGGHYERDAAWMGTTDGPTLPLRLTEGRILQGSDASESMFRVQPSATKCC